ncbi:MAG: HAMP domain-containing histidine kinase [Anaerolineales bacterium]|nr:HAMP domain-containing histidine kinase [Anaerolineales bacterium]MCB9146605.1 HAMP domain-containing histidine kinase [Anaerolineales bacterium]
MNKDTLVQLDGVFREMQSAEDWKNALDIMFTSMRGLFVFDNVAIYTLDDRAKGLDVVYARALGRGKTAEADASWGEGIASDVIQNEHMIIRGPLQDASPNNRLSQIHMLGIPLYVASKLHGALLFVRFGGPEYLDLHIHVASLQAVWASSLLERKQLQEARAELDSVQRQMRLQDDFVSTISHELRTPLGFIKGYSTSLLRQDTIWDEATQREFLTIIDEEADRLAKLIEDMLESARLQSKTIQFKFSPVRLDALVRDVVARTKTHHHTLDIELNMDVLPPVLADGVRFSQVLENLIGNAIKYAPESRIVIQGAYIDNKVLISVNDEGEGIPAEYIPFLFERFYRVPGERTVTGTGLGLYICKQIVMAHHGNIWVESVLDRGTTFFIELPANPTL